MIGSLKKQTGRANGILFSQSITNFGLISTAKSKPETSSFLHEVNYFEEGPCLTMNYKNTHHPSKLTATVEVFCHRV